MLGHFPSKIDELGANLAKSVGRDEDLFRAVCARLRPSVRLAVVRQPLGAWEHVVVYVGTTPRGLMAAYCLRSGLRPSLVCFCTDDGEEVFPDDTAASLGLGDGAKLLVCDSSAMNFDDVP